MAEKTLFINPKQEKLNGILVRSTIDRGVIKSISIPRNDGDFIIVAAQDFGDRNHITVVDTEYPILSSSQIDYKGQPILGIFSYDYEISKLLANEIKIEYDVLESQSVELPSYSFSWGDSPKAMSEPNLRIVNGLYYFSQQSTPGHTILKVKASMKDDGVLIETPTQWPFHVKESISEVMNIPKDKVQVSVKSYYSPKDEYLLQPTLLAVIAAMASKKGQCPVEITSTYPVFKPELVISRTTAIDGNNNIVAEDINANADLGAFPLFTNEIALHMLCGLIPIYPVPNLSIRTCLFVTSKTPSNLFGTLGFSESLCSSEIQMNKVADEIGVSPASWRIDHIAEHPEYQKMVRTEDYDMLKQSIREITEASGFQRKHFAFQQQRHKKNKLNSLLNYARGIGLACGPGINGFSNHFKNLPNYSIRLTLDSNGKLIVNTSFPQKSYVNSIWSSFIAKKMKLSPDDITPVDPLSTELVDTGPDVLSRNIGNISDLIIEGCDKINSRRFKEPLPLVANIATFIDQSRPLFDSHVWVSVVIELEIDPVLISPIVKKCWVNSYFGLIFDQRILETKMRRVIESTIIELGGTPDPEMEDVITFHAQKEGKASSVNQALKAAISAAFTSALSQALNVEQIKLPVSSEYLLEVIKGQ